MDCSQAYDDFELAEIEEALANDMRLIRGMICKETAAAIIETIADSETLEQRQINEISMELSTLV